MNLIELPVYDNFKDYIDSEKINFSDFAKEAYRWLRDNKVDAELKHMEKYDEYLYGDFGLRRSFYPKNEETSFVQDISRAIVIYLKQKVYEHKLLFKTVKDKKLEETFYQAMIRDVEKYVEKYTKKNQKSKSLQ